MSMATTSFPRAVTLPRLSSIRCDVLTAGKMIVLDKLLPKLQAQNSRVLIFSQMTRMLDILEDYLDYRGYKYNRIDGDTEGDTRDAQIEEFNQPGSKTFVFLLSTRAGGLGINLSTADTVIIYDSDWNPQVDLQAQDRAHRIGQTRPVNVYRFVTEHTVEEKIVQRAERRLYLDAMVIQQGKLADSNQQVKFEELLSMVRFGADEIFRSKDVAPTDEDIDTILARGEVRTKQITDNLKEGVNKFLNFDAADEFNIHNWEQGTSGSEMYKLMHEEDETKRTMARSAQQNAQRRLAALKPPKQPTLFPHQFYPKRLYELYQKERIAYESALFALRKAIHCDDCDMDKIQEFTEEDKKEKAELMLQRFADWSCRDFNNFTKACEKFGRKEYKLIAEKVVTKDEKQVKAYAKVFWERIGELKGGERLQKQITKGEDRLKAVRKMQRILDTAVKRKTAAGQDLMQLTLSLRTNKNKLFSTEEDCFMLKILADVGYGNWSKLKERVLASPQMSCNWFLKSRSPTELARRCEALLRLLQKENDRAEATSKLLEEKQRSREKERRKDKDKEKDKDKGRKEKEKQKHKHTDSDDKHKHKHKDKHHKEKGKEKKERPSSSSCESSSEAGSEDKHAKHHKHHMHHAVKDDEKVKHKHHSKDHSKSGSSDRKHRDKESDRKRKHADTESHAAGAAVAGSSPPPAKHKSPPPHKYCQLQLVPLVSSPTSDSSRPKVVQLGQPAPGHRQHKRKQPDSGFGSALKPPPPAPAAAGATADDCVLVRCSPGAK
eukprot:TRINITY_DN2486_c0_g2_i2.p1 TRINITY_DN2486_c0_g2~~TRINITY_DN2486_c0_g2_i2.p1  ORF type:complete len:776 (+),score=255.62 TRINITY_DN2486_c0_g2_i2:1455-3782(+)